MLLPCNIRDPSLLAVFAFTVFRSCFEMVAEVCYMGFSRQFHLWKRERSRSYVTDEKGENGRKGRVNNKSNYFKLKLPTDTRFMSICYGS